MLKASGTDILLLSAFIRHRHARQAVGDRDHSSRQRGGAPFRPKISGGGRLYPPAQKGSIFHRVLQFIDFEAGRKDAQAELGRLIDFKYRLRGGKRGRPAKARTFLESPSHGPNSQSRPGAAWNTNFSIR